LLLAAGLNSNDSSTVVTIKLAKLRGSWSGD